MRARDNPFRTERILQVRYRLQGVTWPDLLCRFERLGYRAAVIGPHGSGKTTLLEDLQPRLRERGFGTRFIRLSEQSPVFAPGFLRALFAQLSGNDILLFDGAEQLRPLAWRWFRWRSRRTAGLLITTHRPGRLPTLLDCCTSPELLAALAAELLSTRAEVTRARAGALFQKHRGNLRDALREWYDLVAAETAPDAPPSRRSACTKSFLQTRTSGFRIDNPLSSPGTPHVSEPAPQRA